MPASWRLMRFRGTHTARSDQWCSVLPASIQLYSSAKFNIEADDANT